MPNGFGRGSGGYGGRGGMGFGFRGSSPPWPYVGIGRGGLPRGAYFLSGAAGVPMAGPYQPTPYAAGPGFGAGPYQQAPYPASPGFDVGQGSYPPYSAAPPTFGNTPFAPQMTPEQELDFLKNQSDMIKGQLEQIETRMQDLESEK